MKGSIGYADKQKGVPLVCVRSMWNTVVNWHTTRRDKITSSYEKAANLLEQTKWKYSKEVENKLKELWDGTWDLYIDDEKFTGLMNELPSVSSVMSDDAPTTTNEAGGKQSHLGAAFELLPPDALTQVAVVLYHGAEKYSSWNWLRISRNDHIRHCLGHIFAYIAKGDIKDLQHAACRLLFSLETEPNLEQEKHYHTTTQR